MAKRCATKKNGHAAVKKMAAIRQDCHNGISIILCTNRPQYVGNIFANYARQLLRAKELVLVLNNNKMSLNKYRAIAKAYPNVTVYQIDESASLGKCLNFAVSKTRYPIIAKFDDDDDYSPYYLNGVAQQFKFNHADVVGKNTCYLYLKSKKLLLLFHPNRENQYTNMVMGSTLAFRRTVFNKIKFRNVSVGEDTYFFEDCAKHRLKVFSCDRYNYVCIRRANRFSHTWDIDEKTIIEHSKRVARTKNFARYATRIVGYSCRTRKSGLMEMKRSKAGRGIE